MANMQDAYDNTGGEMQREMKPIIGWHLSVIVSTERRPPNDKGNQQLQIKFKVTEGQFEGRECSAFLSLWNSNDTAKEIANRSLNSICDAVGILRTRLSNSDMLIGIPLMVQYGPQKDKPEYSEPKYFKPLNAAPRVAGNAAGDGGATSAPWKRQA